jgi:uncharacterized membrane protein
MTIGVVELGQIVEVIWVSLLASLALTIAFSFVVYGTARSAEARRAGRDAVAFCFGTLAVACFAGFLAMIAFGVQIMLTKG